MKKTIEIDIPEGYEIDEVNNVDHNYNKTFNVQEQHLIRIDLKKKQPEKDFNWYIDKFVQGLNSVELHKRNLLNDYFKNREYDKIYFMYRIGLFKFICDDLKINWFFVLNTFIDKMYSIQENIIPREFIESLK